MHIRSKVCTYTIMISLFCFFPAHCIFNPAPSLSPTGSASAPETISESVPAPETVTITDQQPSPVICPDNSPDSNDVPSANTGDKKQEAADFEAEVGAIAMKHINHFYNNGGEGTIGIYIKELSTGYEYGYNESKTNPENPHEGYFKSASTCKLLSAAVIYYLNNKGELELEKPLTDKISGTTYNYKKLIPRMISHSVNEYFNITLRHLGSAKINDVLKELGTQNSMVFSEIMPAAHSSANSNIKRYGISKSPRTNPKDLGHILGLVYDGSILGEENSKELAEALKNNIYSNRLPQGIGYKSPVGHKTGTSSGEGVYNDAGIVYLEGNPYIIVVMSMNSGSNVQSVYRKISAELYEYMKNRIKQ